MDEPHACSGVGVRSGPCLIGRVPRLMRIRLGRRIGDGHGSGNIATANGNVRSRSILIGMIEAYLNT
jgi:hypothetical protein